MSVDKTNVVDAIGVDIQTGELVLTISDHLEWTGSDNEHLLLLQEKLNTYLRFVESGEVLKSYPDAKGKDMVIDVVFMCALNEQARKFLCQVATIVEGVGMKLRHHQFGN